MEKIRIDRFLSSQLNISRKDAKQLLRKRAVTVDSECVITGDRLLVPQVSEVCVNGERLGYKKFIYLMLNKPVGIVSASTSETDVTVVDMVPESLRRSGLFPAGRLDKDSTGFVLITDDGDFAHNILSPAHHVEKTYIVTVIRQATNSELKLFSRGIISGGDTFLPAGITQLGDTFEDGTAVYEVVLSEGKYHQIKRMFASTGNKVIGLKRVAIGKLKLDEGLKDGECRELTAKELELIYKR